MSRDLDLKELTQASGPHEDIIYLHVPTGKYVTLMVDGDSDGQHSGAPDARAEWHDSFAEAASYMRGVHDAESATDYSLCAVTVAAFAEASKEDDDAGAPED